MEAIKSTDDIINALRRVQASGEPPGTELQDLSGVKFTDADLSGLNLDGCNFSGCEMSRCNLSEARCPSATFDGATLYKARLDGAEFLGSTFKKANLTECSAIKTGFGMTDLTEANFFKANLEEATLVDAELRLADFRAAKMTRCRLLEADLEGTDLTQAVLKDADLRDTKIDGADFRNAELDGAKLRGARGYLNADWIGADITDTNFTGAYLLRNHVIDENFIHEFKGQSKLTKYVYFIWKWTSDCGRSLTRWGLFLSANVVLFALIYWVMDQSPPAGMESHLKGIGGVDGVHEGFIAYLYYSVVTFTTLGYGDISPVSMAGQIVLIIHIAFAYLGLGALLSILATKFASRGH